MEYAPACSTLCSVARRPLRTIGVILGIIILIIIPVYFAMPFFTLAQMDLTKRVPQPRCGNGRIEETELCDDENYIIMDGCSGCLVDQTYACRGEPSVCMRAFSYRCGDGAINAGEECDDGNKRDTDGCSRICTRESSL